jgi:hypothetical protein
MQPIMHRMQPKLFSILHISNIAIIKEGDKRHALCVPKYHNCEWQHVEQQFDATYCMYVCCTLALFEGAQVGFAAAQAAGELVAVWIYDRLYRY